MFRVKKHASIPAGSLIGFPNGIIDYSDTYSISLDCTCDISIDSLFEMFMNNSPGWSLILMKLRNILVKWFGLKTGVTEKLTVEYKLQPGDQTGFFKVWLRNDQEIVFYENDRHLNFQSSLLLLNELGNNKLYSITIVRYNNLAGKIYFFFVKPFHRLIIQSLLKQVSKKLATL